MLSSLLEISPGVTTTMMISWLIWRLSKIVPDTSIHDRHPRGKFWKGAKKSFDWIFLSILSHVVSCRLFLFIRWCFCWLTLMSWRRNWSKNSFILLKRISSCLDRMKWNDKTPRLMITVKRTVIICNQNRMTMIRFFGWWCFKMEPRQLQHHRHQRKSSSCVGIDDKQSIFLFPAINHLVNMIMDHTADDRQTMHRQPGGNCQWIMTSLGYVVAPFF